MFTISRTERYAQKTSMPACDVRLSMQPEIPSSSEIAKVHSSCTPTMYSSDHPVYGHETTVSALSRKENGWNTETAVTRTSLLPSAMLTTRQIGWGSCIGTT